MKVVNRLTPDDLKRAEHVPDTPDMMAKSQHAVLDLADKVSQKYINPVIAQQLNLTDREETIRGLYYRLIGYCRSVVRLNEPIHFQSITSAARSAIELYLDLLLLSHAHFAEDGVRRFNAHKEYQRLRSAEKGVQFFEENPALDSAPSLVDGSRDFIKNRKIAIDKDATDIWGLNSKGKPAVPDHWSGRDLKSRADLLADDRVKFLVNQGYDVRNFQVHTGLAGVTGLQPEGFVMLCGLSYDDVATCVIGSMRLVGKEFKLDKVIGNYDETMDNIENISGFALLDLKLRSMGEGSRLWLED